MMFFDGWSDLLAVLVKAPLAYAWVVVVLRISGKRTLSKLNAFDLIVTVAFGSVLASALLDTTVSLAEAALAVVLLAGGQFVVAWATVRSERFSRAVRAEPEALVVHGRAARCAAPGAGLGGPRASLRNAGITDLDRAAMVVLETDGSISVLTERPEPDAGDELADAARPADHGDAGVLRDVHGPGPS
ncbi:MAG: hypothetical protein R2749_17285 [Acidimicrobiales bacterium]